MWKIFALIIFQILRANTNSNLKIIPSTLFPLPSDTIFDLEISPKTESETLITSPLDTMVVRVTDGKMNILDCAKFTYGRAEFVDNEFKGEHLEIPSWKRSSNTIKISFLFKRKSAGKLLEIFFLQTNPNEKCKDIIKRKKKINYFISNKINLSVLFKLNLKVESLNRTTSELLEGDLAVATCRAFGVSNENPSFLNYKQFNLKGHELFSERNERKLWFQVSYSHHGKRLECKIRNTSAAVEVLVHHYPKKLFTRPENLENVEPGSEITCYTADGYPKPKVQLRFLSGPQNLSSFYSIIKNGTTIKLKSGYNAEVKLMFECKAENFILGEKAVVRKIISITVRKRLPQQCNMSCLDSRLTFLEGSFQSQKYVVNTNLTNFQTELKSIWETFKRFPDSTNILKLKENYQNLNREIMMNSTSLAKQIQSVKNEYNSKYSEIKKALKSSSLISESMFKENSNYLKFLKKSIETVENFHKINNKDHKIRSLENSIKAMDKDFGDMKVKNREEIRELRKEIDSLKAIIEEAAKNKLLRSTTSSPVKSGFLPRKRQHSFRWIIDGITERRKNNQNIQSPDYLLNESQVVAIRAGFQDWSTETLLNDIEIYLSFLNKRNPKQAVALIKSTIEISNTKNPSSRKSITKDLYINLNYGTSSVYYFNYNELIKLGILLNDSITITCLLIFNDLSF